MDVQCGATVVSSVSSRRLASVANLVLATTASKLHGLMSSHAVRESIDMSSALAFVVWQSECNCGHSRSHVHKVRTALYRDD